MMDQKKSVLTFGVLLLLFITGCGSSVDESGKAVETKVPVTLTGIQIGELTDQVDLMATSAFIDKSVIQSPTAAYVEEIFIQPGDVVKKNFVLMTLKTKEAHVFQDDSLNPIFVPGVFRIKAACDGIITTIDHPKGDFVTEGAILATISVPGSLVFLLEVPYEMNNLIRINNSCEILLSDGNKIPAKIKSRLPLISEHSQTQKYVIQPAIPVNLPGNLIAKIRVVRQVIPKAQILPKSCILADEMMKEFWVMKMINDTVAIKIPVKTGLSEADNIEIREPVFNADDRFLRTGNYGLGDSVKVFVVKRLEP